MFFVHSTQKNDFVNSYVYFSVYPTKILFRTMKSLVNEVNNAVTESLFGLSFAFPQLEYQESHKVVLMPNLQERKHKVSLICGGGSGHEPFAADNAEVDLIIYKGYGPVQKMVMSFEISLKK